MIHRELWPFITVQLLKRDFKIVYKIKHLFCFTLPKIFYFI